MDDETAPDILEATYRARCQHGYADLAREDVGAEIDRGDSATQHDYAGKGRLFVEVLDFPYVELHLLADANAEAVH